MVDMKMAKYLGARQFLGSARRGKAGAPKFLFILIKKKADFLY